MLYISTRTENDVYTAHKTMVSDRTANGGCYVPFSLPAFTKEEIAGLKDKQFNQIVADVLNLFFSARFTDLDVSFAVGKNPCSMHAMNHRIAVAELWHNSGRNYEFLVEKLYTKLCNHEDCSDVPTDWAKIVIDLAVLIGVYAEMLRDEIIDLGQIVDVSFNTEHFCTICAAWYARKMGIPIGTIICTEKDNGTIWDLLHRGTLSATHADNSAVSAVERLLFGTLGAATLKEFVDCLEKRRTFTMVEEDRAVFSDGLFCSVAGSDRAATVINSVYRSNAYTIDDEAALCYGGLQDYRARNGEGRLTVLFGRCAPVSDR